MGFEISLGKRNKISPGSAEFKGKTQKGAKKRRETNKAVRKRQKFHPELTWGSTDKSIWEPRSCQTGH